VHEGVQPVRPYRAPKFTGPQKISPIVENPMYSSEDRVGERQFESAALAAASRAWRRRDASCSSDHLVSRLQPAIVTRQFI
jgi:hypothetical protein